MRHIKTIEEAQALDEITRPEIRFLKLSKFGLEGDDICEFQDKDGKGKKVVYDGEEPFKVPIFSDIKVHAINELFRRWRRMRLFKVGRAAEADGLQTGQNEDVLRSYEMLKKEAIGLDVPAPYRERRAKFCRRVEGYPVDTMKICKRWWKGYMEGIEKRGERAKT